MKIETTEEGELRLVLTLPQMTPEASLKAVMIQQIIVILLERENAIMEADLKMAAADDREMPTVHGELSLPTITAIIEKVAANRRHFLEEVLPEWAETTQSLLQIAQLLFYVEGIEDTIGGEEGFGTLIQKMASKMDPSFIQKQLIGEMNDIPEDKVHLAMVLGRVPKEGEEMPSISISQPPEA